MSQKYLSGSKTNEKFLISHKNQKKIWEKERVEGSEGWNLKSISIEHSWNSFVSETEHGFESHLHLKLPSDPELQGLHP